MTPQLPPGAVLVVGSGMVGTSVGLALRARGVPVHLADRDPAVVEDAVGRGGGSGAEPADVGLVVVAVPPRSLGAVLVAALQRWRDAVVTDVGSVKALPLAGVYASGVDTSRYVGGHPMAGSERSGPLAASAELFVGRAWAVTPHEQSSPTAIEAVRALGELCGARVVEMSPHEHDVAVARVSHLPHVMATLTAAQLLPAAASELALAGQGLRDVTRIAAGDPALWSQILTGNAAPLRELLLGVRRDLDAVLVSLESGDVSAVESLLVRGRRGTERIPARPGEAATGQPDGRSAAQR